MRLLRFYFTSCEIGKICEQFWIVHLNFLEFEMVWLGKKKIRRHFHNKIINSKLLLLQIKTRFFFSLTTTNNNLPLKICCKNTINIAFLKKKLIIMVNNKEMVWVFFFFFFSLNIELAFPVRLSSNFLMMLKRV